MENIYLFFVIALFVLAISDLIVGVGNDAVNFLNSAIGSKVASFKVIMGIAAIGVLVGATFSSGMMEVARQGVFFPDQFSFKEIMILFLAVMIADIILLDTFNTFGLPTSTTVSIVFELLGAAVAVAIFKVVAIDGQGLQNLSQYINSARALTIVSSILLSVVIAFTVGALVQFLSRLLFTFNFRKTMPYFGAIWGSIAITSIVLFILIKGASGASFMTEKLANAITENTLTIILVSFVGFAIINQILISVFKVNIFKVIVLVGTFSIAMAFAGNDLVNFIGVPLAGYDSYIHFFENPGLNPETYTMESLLNPVKTPTVFLLIAGLIMILALFFSKKSRSVTSTEVDLARQGEGYERFSASSFSRAVVRMFVALNKFFSWLLPARFYNFLDKRMDKTKVALEDQNNAAHFDQLRASVNMFIASILISFATSLKLPLSTTYVTFMVAMGTSLSDRAWGRESAVYRVTGVLTVIGGWFLTGLSAFSIAFLFAAFISWGGVTAAAISLALAFFFVIRTNFLHKRMSENKKKEEAKFTRQWDEKTILSECQTNIVYSLNEVNALYSDILFKFINEDFGGLKQDRKRVKEMNKFTKTLKKDIFLTIRKLKDESVHTGHHYVQIVDYLREISTSMKFIVDPALEHLSNNHKAVVDEQKEKLTEFEKEFSVVYNELVYILETQSQESVKEATEKVNQLIQKIEDLRILQIQLISDNKVSVHNSMVMFNFFSETKTLLMQSQNVLKTQKKFLKDHSE